MELFGLLAISAVLMIALSFGVKIVPHHHRGVVTREADVYSTVGPGLHFVIPLVERMHTIDMRPRTLQLEQVHVTSADDRRFQLEVEVEHMPIDEARRLTAGAVYVAGVIATVGHEARHLADRLDSDDIDHLTDDFTPTVADALSDLATRSGVKILDVRLVSTREASAIKPYRAA